MKNMASLISRNDVIKSLEQALITQPKLRKATRYSLKYKEHFFPPKEVVRLAALEAGIEKADFKKFRLTGGNSTNKHLKKLGFEIVKFSNRNKTESTSPETRIARLCYNKKGWVEPSGPEGKSKDGDTHEAIHGYGHEEWLFDIGRLVDGYHYGFLEPIRKHQDAYKNKIFNVWLYTINAIDKRRYWIGEIENVEVLTSERAEQVKEIYVKCGWFEQMQQQIKASNANTEGFSNWEKVDLFNIRYKPADYHINDPYLELPKDHPVYKQNRYSFASYKDEFLVESPGGEQPFSFVVSREKNNIENNKIKFSVQERAPKLVEIAYLHKALSDGLKKTLRRAYGFKNVTSEHPAWFDNNRIDIVVNDKDGFIFYEIKAYTSLRTAVREAIGQLMEYSLWKESKRAFKLVIVTQPLKGIEDVRKYLRHLRENYNLPVYYQSYDLETNMLSDIT